MIAIATKTCSKCKVEKPATEFHKRARSKDGLYGWCKSCSCERSLERWREKNPDRPKRPKYAPDSPFKICTLCGQEKPVEDFHKAHKGACGRKSICKQCESARRDPIHSRRSLLKNKYGLTLEDYDIMLVAQDGKCFWCGSDSPGDGENYFHIDHDHDSGKVICLSCASCNTGRGYFRDSKHMAAVAARWLVYETQQKERKPW